MLATIIPIVELNTFDDFEQGERVLVETDSFSYPNVYKWYRGVIRKKYTHHALVDLSNGQRECFKYFDMKKVY